MRTVTVLLGWVLGALALGAVAGLTLLDPLTGGGTTTHAAPVRRDPPEATTSASTVALVVELTPIDAPPPVSLGDGDELDIVVRITNATGRPAPGVEVEVHVSGATCRWPTGPFPAPFGLAPAASAERTCRLKLTRQGPGSLRVVAHHGVPVTEAVLDVTWRPPSVDELVAAAPEHAPAEVAATTPLACPRLVDGLELPGSALLEHLGGGISDRAQLLDLQACPSWSAIAGLTATRQQTGDACLPWLIALLPLTEPVARVTPAQGHAGCAGAPVTVEVFDQPSEVGAMIATLAAWAVDGDTTRAAGFARAASGASQGCEAGGIVAVANPHQATTSSQTTYRASVVPC